MRSTLQRLWCSPEPGHRRMGNPAVRASLEADQLFGHFHGSFRMAGRSYRQNPAPQVPRRSAQQRSSSALCGCRGGRRLQNAIDAGPSDPGLPCNLRRAVGLRPLYLPALFALAMPSRCRSSMISRSNCAMDTKRLSMRRPDADPVSRLSPPMLRMRRLAPLRFTAASMARKSETERAKRSSFVMQMVSPSRANSRAASSCARSAIRWHPPMRAPASRLGS